MKRTPTLLILCLVLAVAGTALAGDKHAKEAKCTDDTQTCLNRLASKVQSKGWLGVKMEKTESGFSRITEVIADSPAEAAGFQAGDLVVAINGVVLTEDNHGKLKEIKASFGPGKTANYVVKRAGGKQKLAVTLGHVPAMVMAEWIGQHMVRHHVETVVASVD